MFLSYTRGVIVHKGKDFNLQKNTFLCTGTSVLFLKIPCCKHELIIVAPFSNLFIWSLSSNSNTSPSLVPADKRNDLLWCNSVVAHGCYLMNANGWCIALQLLSLLTALCVDNLDNMYLSSNGATSFLPLHSVMVVQSLWVKTVEGWFPHIKIAIATPASDGVSTYMASGTEGCDLICWCRPVMCNVHLLFPVYHVAHFFPSPKMLCSWMQLFFYNKGSCGSQGI